MEQNAKENGVEFVDLLGLKRVTGTGSVISVISVISQLLHSSQIVRWFPVKNTVILGDLFREGPESQFHRSHWICHSLMIQSPLIW